MTTHHSPTVRGLALALAALACASGPARATPPPAPHPAPRAIPHPAPHPAPRAIPHPAPPPAPRDELPFLALDINAGKALAQTEDLLLVVCLTDRAQPADPAFDALWQDETLRAWLAEHAVAIHHEGKLPWQPVAEVIRAG